MKDLIILNKSLPVIESNFEEVKKDLKEQLEQYKTLVVTDESLIICKGHQKSLAGLRNTIDTYRKDIKKAMSAPIAEFEDKCKQLVGLIEDAEQPLKDGIKVFDDVKREEKKQAALTIVSSMIVKFEIVEKYQSQLTVLDKYTQLSAKTSETKNDIEQRASTIRVQQLKDLELLELIQDAIDTANKTINKKLNISDYQMLIDRGVSTKEVIQAINKNASMIFEAENPPEPVIEVIPEPIEVIPVVETIPEPIVELIPEPIVVIVEDKKEKKCFIELRVEGIVTLIEDLKLFMMDNNIVYEVKGKGWVIE